MTAYTPANRTQRQTNLNRISPAAFKSKLGDTIYDLTNQINLLQTAYAALLASHAALLAHLDTANVAGIGNANAATYNPAAVTLTTVLLPEQRPSA